MGIVYFEIITKNKIYSQFKSKNNSQQSIIISYVVTDQTK